VAGTRARCERRGLLEVGDKTHTYIDPTSSQVGQCIGGDTYGYRTHRRIDQTGEEGIRGRSTCRENRQPTKLWHIGHADDRHVPDTGMEDYQRMDVKMRVLAGRTGGRCSAKSRLNGTEVY